MFDKLLICYILCKVCKKEHMKKEEQWYVLRGSDRRIYISRCSCETLKRGHIYKAGTDVAEEIYDDGMGFIVLRVCNTEECALLSALNALDEAVNARHNSATSTFMFTLEDLIWSTMCASRRPRKRRKTSK